MPVTGQPRRFLALTDIRLEDWRYLLTFFRPACRFLLISLLVSAFQTLSYLPMAFFVRRAFDQALPARRTDLFLLYGLAVVGLTLVNSSLTLWNRHITLGIIKTAIRDLRDEIIAKSYTLSRSYYGHSDQNRHRFTIVQDTERLDLMSCNLLTQALPALLVSATLAGLLVYLNYFLFLVLAVFSALAIAIGWRMKSRIVAANLSFKEALTHFNRSVLFVLQMMDLTRVQTAESFELERQRTGTEALRKNSRRAEWLRIAYVEVQSLILAIAGVIILIVGGAAIVRGMMTVGELISFYFIVGLLGANMRAWWSSIPSLLAGCDSLASIHALMRSKDLEPYTGRGRIDFKGEIRFEGVRFDYGGAPVLKEVDWIITPGTSTVLLGPNGSGKTSLVHLILGFYRPRAGTLKADGIPYGELDVRALRRQIGVMPQHSDLFSGTVRANLTYGLDEIIPERIDEACRLVGADTFIQGLERGYESQVGENGMLLSGGQRQRLLLARAILRRPRLLILDEPTNHLDENSIRPIAQKLRQLDFRPAILWITHHPFLQEGAERILTLDQGRLVEATPSPTRFG